MSKNKAPASVYDIGKVKFSYSQKLQKKRHGENKPISSLMEKLALSVLFRRARTSQSSPLAIGY